MKAAFLRTFADSANVRYACEAAGIQSRKTAYAWRASDSDFAAAWDDAEQDANDLIRAEIRRRGQDGWDEITEEKSSEISEDGIKTKTTTKTVHKYDSGLLKLLAQAHMPEFKDRLDVTTGDDKLTGYEAIINDESAAALAAQLVERLAGYGLDAGGLGLDSER